MITQQLAFSQSLSEDLQVNIKAADNFNESSDSPRQLGHARYACGAYKDCYNCSLATGTKGKCAWAADKQALQSGADQYKFSDFDGRCVESQLSSSSGGRLTSNYNCYDSLKLCNRVIIRGDQEVRKIPAKSSDTLSEEGVIH